MDFLCIFEINPSLDISLANTFSYFVGCLLILLAFSFAVQKPLVESSLTFLFLLLLPVLLVLSYPKKLLPRPMSRRFFLMFSSRIFIVLSFKSLIHFE